jgi:hypothetical protein
MNKVFLLSLLLAQSLCFGQGYRNSYTNVGFQMVQPMDTLKYLLDGNFYGINAGTNLPIFNSGIEIGFDYSWARLEHKDEDFVINYFVSVTGQYVYENATMYLQNRNNRYVTNLRLRPFNGKFQPYAELNCGFESYRVLADVIKEGYGYSYASNSNFQYYDITYVTGWSAGLRISSNEKLFVDFKFQNLKSGPVNYVKLNTFTIIDDENIFYEKIQITPKKFVYQVGLSYTY